MRECPNCNRRVKGSACRVCGWQVPGEVKTPAKAPRLLCDCGALLLASGLCSATGG